MFKIGDRVVYKCVNGKGYDNFNGKTGRITRQSGINEYYWTVKWDTGGTWQCHFENITLIEEEKVLEKIEINDLREGDSGTITAPFKFVGGVAKVGCRSYTLRDLRDVDAIVEINPRPVIDPQPGEIWSAQNSCKELKQYSVLPDGNILFLGNLDTGVNNVIDRQKWITQRTNHVKLRNADGSPV